MEIEKDEMRFPWPAAPLTARLKPSCLWARGSGSILQIWMLSLQADFWLVLYCCFLLFFCIKFIETEKDNLCLKEEKKELSQQKIYFSNVTQTLHLWIKTEYIYNPAVKFLIVVVKLYFIFWIVNENMKSLI